MRAKSGKPKIDNRKPNTENRNESRNPKPKIENESKPVSTDRESWNYTSIQMVHTHAHNNGNYTNTKRFEGNALLRSRGKSLHWNLKPKHHNHGNEWADFHTLPLALPPVFDFSFWFCNSLTRAIMTLDLSFTDTGTWSAEQDRNHQESSRISRNLKVSREISPWLSLTQDLSGVLCLWWATDSAHRRWGAAKWLCADSQDLKNQRTLIVSLGHDREILIIILVVQGFQILQRLKRLVRAHPQQTEATEMSTQGSNLQGSFGVNVVLVNKTVHLNLYKETACISAAFTILKWL